MPQTALQDAQNCAEAFQNLRHQVEKILQHYPRGKEEAKFSVRGHEFTQSWPFLKCTGLLETAHQRLTFETVKGNITELIWDFYTSCTRHPTLGPHLAQNPREFFTICFQEDQAMLEFGGFSHPTFSPSWLHHSTMERIISKTTVAPRFSDTPLFFLEHNKQNAFGHVNLEPDSFKDIYPFFHIHTYFGTCDTQNFEVWKEAPSTHSLFEVPLLIIEPISLYLIKHEPLALNDENAKSIFVDLAKNYYNGLIAIPYTA